MPAKGRIELKKYFRSGSKASESQYIDLIDSFYGMDGDNSNVLPDVFERTLFVDVNATPGTGEKGKINNPFTTITEARAEAVSGDIVIIFPGTHYTGNMYKNGVEYVAMPGVTIIPDGSSEPGFYPALFAEYTPAAIGYCALFGYAIIDLQNESALTRAWTFSQLEIEIECKEILDNNVTVTGSILQGLYKRLTIHTEKIVCNSSSSFIGISALGEDFHCSVTCHEVILANGLPFGSMGGGYYLLQLGHVQAEGYTDDNPIFISNVSGRVRIYNTVIHTNVSRLAGQANGSRLTLDKVRFITSSGFGSSLPILNIAPIWGTMIKNSEFIETGVSSGRDSLAGGGAVRIMGVLNTNLPKASSVTVMIGEFNYDSTLTIS